VIGVGIVYLDKDASEKLNELIEKLSKKFGNIKLHKSRVLKSLIKQKLDEIENEKREVYKE